MTPNRPLPSPTTTKPRSAFARLRAVTSSPHPPPASAAAWTSLLDEALLEAYGDADGARLAVAVLSTLPGEKPCEALAIVQCRAGEERRVWAALTLLTRWAGQPVRVDVVGVSAWGMGGGCWGDELGGICPSGGWGGVGVQTR
eukprot:TRINITY_DN5609_c0_g1_i1.p1 TRINITY_DN5609_c0_g1~~TRINITY_DN5609_c0_g1_i1.p1  ORF type:complete len:143 (-),score=20.97 TRINITY_DN5609_c0_g1_i1:343-771(-)